MINSSARSNTLLRFAVFASVALAASSCTDPVSPRAPVVAGRIDSLATPPTNILSRWVFATITGADSAWVEVTGTNDALQRSPAVRAVDGRNALLVVGLRQGVAYTVRVVTKSSAGDVSAIGTAATVTDSVPSPLRDVRYTVSGTASRGYTAMAINFSPGSYIVAYDSIGNLRWYYEASRALPDGIVGDIQQLRAGGFLAYIGYTSGWQPVVGSYFRIGLDGTTAATLNAPAAFYTDSHEIIPLYSGDSLTGSIMFGYDIRPTNMTAFGGGTATQLAGHTIFRQRLPSTVEFFWNAWDHLSIADWIEEPVAFKTRSSIDFDHPNAMVVDVDGNYVVSWRGLAELTKIDARTGAIIWRWGGANNQFTTLNDPLGFFSGQHSIQVLANGNYLLYDNGLRHSPSESRAAEYRLDLVLHTATLVWQYRHTPPLFTMFTGSVQRLANGNTLIGWMGAGTVSEVTAGGQLVSEGIVTRGAPLTGGYRAKRINSLYRGDAP